MRTCKLNKGTAYVASSRSAREGAVLGVGRFDTLALLEFGVKGVEKSAIQQNDVAGGSKDVVDNAPLREKGSAANLDSAREDVVEMLVESSDVGKTILQGSSSTSKGTNGGNREVVGKVGVASSVEVLPSHVTLNPKDHMAVRVLERGADYSRSPSDGHHSNPIVGIALPKGTQQVMVGKGAEKKGNQNRRKSDVRNPSKVVLGDC
ncbi:hypothetical protein V6N12_009813 [Hibiscus sabdariffa]|uniref:Uncharacterized protein n=1 Tax=Hibiscus sabdariffa TaxID=183260 RepID=A0ABR2EBT9_9ROSI